MPTFFTGTEVFPVSTAEIAFPFEREWFTPWKSIPDEHKRDTCWVHLYRSIAAGIKPGADLRLLPRSDTNTGNVHSESVMQMIRCVWGCYGIKHEHKEALLSYIFASFFSHGWFVGEEPPEFANTTDGDPA